MRAYVYDTADTSDQREAHDTGINKTVEELKRIGVLYWQIGGPTAMDDLNALAKERDYKNRDEVRYKQKKKRKVK